MRNTLLLVTIYCVVISCDKFPDPSVIPVKDYSFNFLTESAGKFAAGDWVSDSIKFRATNNKIGLNDSVKVFFEIMSGDGKLTVQSAYTNKNSLASTGWKLGTSSCKQTLRANSFDLKGNYLTSTDLIEYGFRNNEWNEYQGLPDAGMFELVADSVNRVTFMVSNGTLFQQGEKYYNWNPVINSLLISPRTISIDNSGNIYVSLYSGDLIKSTDHGNSWKTCTKPYSDYLSNIYVSVSNDNWIWVFAYTKPIRFSKDGGNTWIDAGSNLQSEGLSKVFRLSDGSLLFHGSYCCSLKRSVNNGLTWSKIETPGSSLKLYVDDKGNVFILTQENGTTIYMSADNCATFNRVYNIPYSINIYENNRIFNKSGGTYYLCLSGYGIVRSTNLSLSESYEMYYSNAGIINFFIDHSGVLIGRSMNYNTLFYRNNTKK